MDMMVRVYCHPALVAIAMAEFNKYIPTDQLHVTRDDVNNRARFGLKYLKELLPKRN
jgi:hypothetical protein